MSVIVVIAVAAAVLTVPLIADFLFYRLMIRALFGLIDLLLPHRPGGRYRSQSTPEKYASLRKPRNGT